MKIGTRGFQSARGKGAVMDSRRRTVTKAVLWNLLGLATMSLVGLALTGSAVLGGTLAAVNTAVGFVCYILYERVWARVAWGRRERSHG